MDMTQSYDHELNATKGWFSPYALDKTTTQAADSTDIVPGSLCCLNASGNSVLGLVANAMPLFAFSLTETYTGAGPAGVVANMNGHMTGRFYGEVALQSVAAKPVLCLVALGAYELETTEFVAATYVPNQPLTGDVPGSATEGKVAAGAYGTDTICGIVSDGTVTNNYSKSALRFWPVFFPVFAVA